MFEIERPTCRIWSPHPWPADQAADGNIDVHVRLPDGAHYVGTVFSLANVDFMLDKSVAEERLPGVWSGGMVVVRTLDEPTLVSLIERLIERGELERVFERVIEDE